MRSLAIMLAALVLAGCASSPKQTGPTAVCPVCVHNRDLACIKVAVGEKTPRCTCGRKTFYFCSEECRKAFEKNPAKFPAP